MDNLKRVDEYNAYKTLSQKDFLVAPTNDRFRNQLVYATAGTAPESAVNTG